MRIAFFLKIFRTAVPIIGLLIVGASCGGGRNLSLESIQPKLLTRNQGSTNLASAGIQDILSELSNLEDEKARPALLKLVASELAKELTALGVERFVARAPSQQTDKVTDLSVSAIDGGTYELSWSYRNTGDYDQNGIVDIRDIVPLARHFFHSVGKDATDEVVDGNSDGKIDILDVKPLASNFFSQCARYSVEMSQTQDVGYTEVESVPFSSPTVEGRKVFQITSSNLTVGYYVRVVPYDAQGNPGIPSDPMQVPPSEDLPPVARLTAQPTEGEVPLLVNFDASESYDPDGEIVKYEWDYQGDGTYDQETTTPSSSFTYNQSRPNPYSATVRVTDDEGATSSANVSIRVLPFGEAPNILSLYPLSGLEGDDVTFTANVTGTPPFDFIFEFTTNTVDPETVVGTDSEVKATVSLRTPGTYTVNLTVRNELGETARDFTYSIVPLEENRGDWWMVGREPLHQARSPLLGPQGEDSFRWSFNIYGGTFNPGPVISVDGSIYIGGSNETRTNQFLYALNPDGTLKWRFQTQFVDDIIGGSPAIARDGSIYFPGGRRFYALNPQGDTPLWVFDTGPGSFIGTSPAIALGGTIYFGANDTYLYALYPHGELKWRYKTDGSIRSSPAIGEDSTVYFGSSDNYVYAVNADGSLKWRYQTGGDVIGSPSIFVDSLTQLLIIYVGSTDGKLYALDDTGTVLWSLDIGSALFSSPAIGEDGTIYIGSDGGELIAVNPDGTEKWRFQTSDAIHSSPAIGLDGTIYFGSDDSWIYALTPEGTEKWKYQANQSIRAPLAIGLNGSLIVNTVTGTVYAFWDTPPEPPQASLSANPTSGEPPLTVDFDASASSDSDGSIVKYEWDWEGDGTFDYDSGTDPTAQYTYESEGEFVATVRVTDDDGLTDTESVTITVSLPPQEPPIAVLRANPTSGRAPLLVMFDASGSYDPDGGIIILYEWDWEGDGVYEESTVLPLNSHVYTEPNDYFATVRVTDDDNLTDTDSVLITVTVQTSQGDWWMFGRNRLHQSQSPFMGPTTDTVYWSLEIGRVDRSSPAMSADGTIYIGSLDDKLYAINPDGSIKWVFSLLMDGVYSSPAVGEDGRIYFGTRNDDKRLIALNSDGSLAWSYPMPGFVHSSPAIGTDGSIYVGVGDLDTNVEHYFYALNPDGSLKWRYQTGGYVNSSPAIAPDGTVYVGCNDRKLYAFDPEDGTVLWSFTAEDMIISSPTIGEDGTIYFGSNDTYLYALDPADAGSKYKWRYKTDGAIWSKPALGPDGTIYFGSWDNFLYALNSDGSLKWKYDAQDKVYCSPAVGADGTIYFGTYNFTDGMVIALNPDGSLLWSYNVGAEITGGLAIGEDGTLYVGCNDFTGDDFYAFRD